MEKVFLKDQVIVFSNKASKEFRNVEVRNKKLLHQAIINWLADENRDDIHLHGYSLEQMKADFIKSFFYLEAAGGVVFNPQKKVLFIRRSGIWDLPKGKMDKDESEKECAVREVEEETGVKGLEITDDLNPSYHIYWHNSKWFLKKTYWFFMKTESDEALKPQLEEDITEARWLDHQECREALKETFRSIRECIGEKICQKFQEIK